MIKKWDVIFWLLGGIDQIDYRSSLVNVISEIYGIHFSIPPHQTGKITNINSFIQINILTPQVTALNLFNRTQKSPTTVNFRHETAEILELIHLHAV